MGWRYTSRCQYAARLGYLRRDASLLRSGLPLPAGFIAPCLPTSAPRPPSGALWLHEIKHDGFRIVARKDGNRVRPGNDLTKPQRGGFQRPQPPQRLSEARHGVAHRSSRCATSRGTSPWTCYKATSATLSYFTTMRALDYSNGDPQTNFRPSVSRFSRLARGLSGPR